jgi:anaerobic magnesium-protoporphyrin IX monomethyl ester cyclase
MKPLSSRNRSDSMPGDRISLSAALSSPPVNAEVAVNVLLLSMPDSFEHMPSLVVRMPNGALTSLAANLDPHHQVAVADLILVQDRVRQTVERLVEELRPDVVGLSVMTFQRRTAHRVIRLVRRLRPEASIVVGGYDPSLAPAAYMDGPDCADHIVHGEGESTFRELLRALESGTDLESIAGLTFRRGDEYVRTPNRPPLEIARDAVLLPRRDARVLSGYTLLGRQVDVIETSRGCTFDCSFCSIIEMRGRNFHRFPVERVVADIADARSHGARSIFLVDDNIVLDVRRFEAICHSIIEAGLNDLDYFVQAMTSTLANHGEHLAPLMRRAGFRYVFLGIENILEEDLEFLRARRKNTRKEGGRSAGNASVEAIRHVHANGMYVVGGLIVGNPDDTVDSIEANLAFAKRHIDWPYIQHPTPYPRTPMTEEFRALGLIETDRVEEYDGTTPVVRTRHLEREEVAFRRWRAERWMKLRHLPSAFAHDPWFVARNAHRMAAHTFRGSTWRTWLRLEDERNAFRRYCEIREREREYLVEIPLERVPGSTADAEPRVPLSVR